MQHSKTRFRVLITSWSGRLPSGEPHSKQGEFARDTEHMTLQEAAEQLGVHYQTVYRWVRDGDLTAVKRGNSYQVSDDEVDRFRLLRQVPTAPRELLVVRSWEGQRERLLAALLAGAELDARAVADRLIEGNVATLDICEKLVAPCLTEIGDRWLRGEVSIAEEHRATAICSRLLARAATHPRGRPRGTVVVLAAPGDAHSLPSAMAALVLREDRWRVHHLESNVPTDDLIALAHDVKADLIVFSNTYAERELVLVVVARLRREGFKVIVGGSDGKTLTDLIEVARTHTKANETNETRSPTD
jgi:MerR family transcriptional regulator, light-induced transcriptional regulator